MIVLSRRHQDYEHTLFVKMGVDLSISQICHHIYIAAF